MKDKLYMPVQKLQGNEGGGGTKQGYNHNTFFFWYTHSSLIHSTSLTVNIVCNYLFWNNQIILVIKVAMRQKQNYYNLKECHHIRVVPHQIFFNNMLLVFGSRFDNKLACASQTGMFFLKSLPNTTLRSVVMTHTFWTSTMEPTLKSLKRQTRNKNE